MLAAAADTIAVVPICWVATPTEDGGDANVRAVHDGTVPGGDPWTRCFVARRDSRKVAELRRTGRATLAYQHGSGNAYVTLGGCVEVVDGHAAVAAVLRPGDDPDGSLAARLVLVRVTADRLEMHARGVTAGPWGHGRTLLARAAAGAWRLLPD